MRELQMKEAKAKLSALVDDVCGGENVVITRHGRKDVVMISWDEWERLSKIPSLLSLLCASPLEDGDLAERDTTPLSSVDF